MALINLYTTLGVGMDALPKEIKVACDAKLREVDSMFVTDSPQWIRAHHLVELAFTVLMDNTKRAKHDQQLRDVGEAPPINPIPPNTPSSDSKNYFGLGNRYSRVMEAGAIYVTKKGRENFGTITKTIRDDTTGTTLTSKISEMGQSRKGTASITDADGNKEINAHYSIGNTFFGAYTHATGLTRDAKKSEMKIDYTKTNLGFGFLMRKDKITQEKDGVVVGSQGHQNHLWNAIKLSHTDTGEGAEKNVKVQFLGIPLYEQKIISLTMVDGTKAEKKSFKILGNLTSEKMAHTDKNGDVLEIKKSLFGKREITSTATHETATSFKMGSHTVKTHNMDETSPLYRQARATAHAFEQKRLETADMFGNPLGYSEKMKDSVSDAEKRARIEAMFKENIADKNSRMEQGITLKSHTLS